MFILNTDHDQVKKHTPQPGLTCEWAKSFSPLVECGKPADVVGVVKDNDDVVDSRYCLQHTDWMASGGKLTIATSKIEASIADEMPNSTNSTSIRAQGTNIMKIALITYKNDFWKAVFGGSHEEVRFSALRKAVAEREDSRDWGILVIKTEYTNEVTWRLNEGSDLIVLDEHKDEVLDTVNFFDARMDA